MPGVVAEALAGGGSMGGASYVLDKANGVSDYHARWNAIKMAPFGVPWDQFFAGLLGRAAWLRSSPWASRIAGGTLSFGINSSIQGGAMMQQFYSADEATREALAREGVTDYKSAFKHGAVHAAAMNIVAALGASQRSHLESVKSSLIDRKNPMTLEAAEKLYGTEAVHMALQQLKPNEIKRLWEMARKQGPKYAKFQELRQIWIEAYEEPAEGQEFTPQRRQKQREQKQYLEGLSERLGFKGLDEFYEWLADPTFMRPYRVLGVLAGQLGFTSPEEMMAVINGKTDGRGAVGKFYWKWTEGRLLVAQIAPEMQKARREQMYKDPATNIDELLAHPLFSQTQYFPAVKYDPVTRRYEADYDAPPTQSKFVNPAGFDYIPANKLDPMRPDHYEVIAQAAEFMGKDPMDVLPFFAAMKPRPGQSLTQVLKKMGNSGAEASRGLLASGEITPKALKNQITKIRKGEGASPKDAEKAGEQNLKIAMGTLELHDIFKLVKEEAAGGSPNQKQITEILDGLAGYTGISGSEFRTGVRNYMERNASSTGGPYNKTLFDSVEKIRANKS
jgi:hypothetical protein